MKRWLLGVSVAIGLTLPWQAHAGSDFTDPTVVADLIQMADFCKIQAGDDVIWEVLTDSLDDEGKEIVFGLVQDSTQITRAFNILQGLPKEQQDMACVELIMEMKPILQKLGYD